MNDRIIVPLDVPTAHEALALVERLGPDTTFYKVGLELFSAEGPGVVGELGRRGKDVFLDLKLHDIPNTVAKAVERAAGMGIRFLTVHATGGSEMIRAAAEAADGRVVVLAVTVLTSLDGGALARIWGRPVPEVRDEVARLAELAVEAGAGGIVCSPWEAGAVAAALGDGHEIVTPGIRFSEGGHHDQKRVATPAEAMAAGATRLVMGRAITGAAKPVDAFRRAVEEARSGAGAVAS